MVGASAKESYEFLTNLVTIDSNEFPTNYVANVIHRRSAESTACDKERKPQRRRERESPPPSGNPPNIAGGRQLSLQRRRGRLGTESEEQRKTRSMIQNNLAQNDRVSEFFYCWHKFDSIGVKPVPGLCQIMLKLRVSACDSEVRLAPKLCPACH